MSLTQIPEATLEQLDIQDAAFGEYLTPKFMAMYDGCDMPAGVWFVYDDMPVYNDNTGRWESDGLAYEIGIDTSDGLIDTPPFQRWVKPECSLIRIVEATDAAPQYHPDHYVRQDGTHSSRALSTAH